jgi:hypothetical protein
MSTTEPTAEDHIREARRYAASAEEREDADSYADALRRTNDLQAAQVHATLAQTLQAAELVPMMAVLVEWVREQPAAPAGDEEVCPGGC